MDLESTMSTIGGLSDQVTQTIQSATSYIPPELGSTLKGAVSYLPAKVDLLTSAQFILYFSVAALIFGVLGRVVLGKRSSLNRSLSATIGILLIYVVTIIIYTFKPWDLTQLLSPLPFVTFNHEYLIIFPMTAAKFPALCTEVLSLIILAFLVNLIDTILPQGKNPITWYLLRFLTVIVSMVLHLLVRKLLHAYLPGVLVTYAPTILLILLVFMLLSGVLTLILGLVISLSNPFMGAMYTFFFSTVVGKQLSKAIFSTAILCAMVYILEFFGYTVLCIAAEALIAYIPLLLVLLALWYLIGHVL